MFPPRNVLILAVILALAGAGGYWAWQRQQALDLAARQALRQETVARGTLLSIVSATGVVAPEGQVNLFFAAAQPLPIVEVNVELGQAVAAGQVLARLEAGDLELAVTQAEQAVRAAELTVQQLRAAPRPEDVALAEANLKLAQAQVYAASQGRSPEEVQVAYLNLRLAQTALNQTYASMDALVARGQWAQKDALRTQEDQQIEAAQVANLRYQQAQQPPTYGPVASAQAGVAQAQVALGRLQSGPNQDDLEIARLRLTQAQAALSLAQNNLKDAELRAPFAGLVAAVNARPGEMASSAVPALTLVDARQYHVDVAVDEVDVARLAAGQLVTVTLDALPDLFLSGRVEKIAPTAGVNQGVVSYQVRIQLDSAAAALRGGLTATADIVVRAARDVVLAPNWAIRRERETGRAFVGRLVAGQVQETEVTLGLRNDIYSEVIAGLQAGDVVAVQTARKQFSLFGSGQ